MQFSDVAIDLKQAWKRLYTAPASQVLMTSW